jgi:hypothetical protein
VKLSTLLQVVALALFALGVAALALGGSSLGVFGVGADELFSAGVVFTSVGVVMFADVRRRARRAVESP